MDFELPATKEELQDLLREIDDYYRNYKGEYEEKPLEEPMLQKLSFTPSSEESVRRAVEAEFGEKTDAEAAEKTAEYEALCQKYDDLASAEDTETEKRLADAAAAYEEKLKKLEADAAKRGIARSSAYLSLRAALETEYEGEKAEIGRQAREKTAGYLRERDFYRLRADLVASAVEMKYGAAVEAEVRSRMHKEREYADEVTRYNNQVEEKLVKGRNDKTETESTLKLRYLELTAKGLTEEQLVQLGYYKDTIRAIDGYYYTIAAQAAYDDFSKDASMNYYLGPYYDDILYKYSLRKNNG